MASLKARVKKHRGVHRLVQAWVSPKLREALDARARREGRTLAGLVRHELGKLVGIVE